MSSLERKNTVSRSSGPSHMNSYALRGVPIKYKTPIYVPDPLYLPAMWKPPEMIPANRIGYNYKLENAILAQARTRALSVAAEESLKRQQIEEIQRQQREREEAEAKAAQEATQPLLLFSNDILTPTPVSSSNNITSNNEATAETQQGSDSDSPKSTSGVELTMEPPIKSLGQLSIREFEANTDDPFEIASLQAINDMEVLQSVLQPIPAPVLTAQSNQPPSSSPSASSPQTSQASTLATPLSRTQSSPIPAPRAAPRTSKNSVPDMIQKPAGLYRSRSPPLPVAPVQNLPSQMGTSMPFPTANSSPALIEQVSPPVPEPGVGLLIDIGGEAGVSSQPPSAVRPPLYGVQVEQPQGSTHPVPKPRAHLSSANVSQSPPYPNGPSSAPNPSPPVPPKGIRSAVTPTQEPVGHPPSVLPKPAAQGSIGFAVPSRPSPFSAHGVSRPGLGVPVLPPIPTSSTPPTSVPTAIPRNIPPPAYSSPRPQPRGVALPPYSSPPKTSPRASPKTYKLPDPQSSLNSLQKSKVQSITSMGFPPARVARAVLRFEGENTTQEILDFLFLVGQLEEKRFAGDSAETALIACKDDLAKAEEYLKQIEQYKEFGFSEKKIHEAYEKSSGDWDKALDLLTEGR